VYLFSHPEKPRLELERCESMCVFLRVPLISPERNAGKETVSRVCSRRLLFCACAQYTIYKFPRVTQSASSLIHTLYSISIRHLHLSIHNQVSGYKPHTSLMKFFKFTTLYLSVGYRSQRMHHTRC